MTSSAPNQPTLYHFADDGRIPNSRLPVLHYSQVSASASLRFDDWLESVFTANNWLGIWRNGILPYDHYHSTTHEVLGIYTGSAQIRLGGAPGQVMTVRAGDVLVIPAGVGHCNLQHSADFAVLGAYPDGRDWDLLRGEAGERPRSDKTIAQVPLPTTDPLYGPTGPLRHLWT